MKDLECEKCIYLRKIQQEPELGLQQRKNRIKYMVIK
jgi:hypothetical protein